ncbi:hypothetical protein B0J18DRAFT_470719 [Chaetomium sp. MPI-SDFR-AT-0129]|nr:hypothetical protein B0J18DRAFT_470719 [Chaetomium sp. MPI-SDFR-AT-0129]
MDKLIGKAADKFFGDDDDKRPQVTHGGAYPPSGGVSHDDDEDLQGAASVAAGHAPEDQDFFKDVLGSLLQEKPKAQIGNEDIDEKHTIESHKQFFGSGDSQGPASSSSVGSAAALQALKLFTSGNQGQAQGKGGQNAFVGLAMAQAAKLFDAQASQGNVEPGADKQSAVKKAGETALKLYLKSKGGSAGAGAGVGGGGVDGLLGLASKFL